MGRRQFRGYDSKYLSSFTLNEQLTLSDKVFSGLFFLSVKKKFSVKGNEVFSRTYI
jgi:hypothetical protein